MRDRLRRVVDDSSSPSHASVAACGSIALWLWRGVRVRRIDRDGAAASAASASPIVSFSGSPWNSPGSVPCALASAKPVIAGSAS